MESSLPIVIFGFFGILLLSLGINRLLRNYQIKKNGLRTMATIVDLDIESDWDSEDGARVDKYPIIQFRNKYGEIIRKKLDHGSGSNFIGQNIPIIYIEKNNQYNIVINSNFWLVKFPLGMLLIGFIILLVIGILAF